MVYLGVSLTILLALFSLSSRAEESKTREVAKRLAQSFEDMAQASQKSRALIDRKAGELLAVWKPRISFAPTNSSSS